MSDIFISYARSTEAQAHRVAEALRGLGHNVWRDDEIPAHQSFSRMIEERLAAAKVVLVLWSVDAAASEWVRSEASRARAMGKLVQLTLDKTPLPIPFDQIQCANLVGWGGEADALGWRKVVASIADLMGAPVISVSNAPLPLPLPTKPSIAVMPFANLSGDPDQEYFADGMVEEIVSALSRFKSIFVIGSGSTLSFKGEAVGPQEVARQLGVRFVLEGSIRRAGARVRIQVKLIDATHGAQMWSERFEDTLEDVFALQDRVALSVAGVIEPAVNRAEIRRALQRPTDSLGGYDLYLRALVHFRTQERDRTLNALDLLRRSIALDPDYGSALSLAASCHSRIAARGWSEDPLRDRAQGVELARRALLVNGDDPEILVRAASVLSQDSDEDVSALFDRAIALNPGSSAVWLLVSDHQMRIGNADMSAAQIEVSMRLDPFSPIRSVQLSMLGTARFFQGRFAEALAALREAAQLLHANAYVHVMMAACYGRLAEPDLARQSLARYKSLVPSSILTGDAIQAQIAQNFRNPAHRRLLLEGIALAEAKSPSEVGDAQ